MSAPEAPISEPSAGFNAVFDAMGSAFAALGRSLVCLGPDFGVLHASATLEDLIGREAASALPGRPAAALLGEELFGPGGTMRQALLAGSRQEGWRATLRGADGAPLDVSVTAAPIRHSSGSFCDPRVNWIVVLRPGADDPSTGTQPPTVFEGLVARSQSMLALFRLIEILEASETTILLTGASGTGKEVLARAVHARSARRAGPFVAVNCAALPEQLLESELFGHVRGAFTGAVRDRVGRFELAAGGTLFLDEVGDTSPALQARLLRVLQERTYERVGESASREADVRVIAATHRDLEALVASGEFRDDLYYRLRVVPIHIPPLSERREDIAPLATHLLARVGARHGRSLRLSPDALRALLEFDWPGNVRQLENALEFAVAVCQGQTVHISDLPPELQQAPGPDAPPVHAIPAPAPGALDREAILEALEATRWRREAAAEALGISRTTLWRRMRELGIS